MLFWTGCPWHARITPNRMKGHRMHRKHMALSVVAALALYLSACGENTDRTTGSTYGSDPARTAEGPVTSSPTPGERPGGLSNPKGVSDTSPSIPGSGENRPENKEQPFGRGSPQTSMKGAEIPAVAPPPNESTGEGRKSSPGQK